MKKRLINDKINKEITMIEVLKAIDDRIDWLTAKYRDSEGDERTYWKTRHNEAKTIRETVIIYGNINAKKGNASDFMEGKNI
jgi:hypothetical protein